MLMGWVFPAGALILDQRFQELCRARPDRTKTSSIAFAHEADLTRRFETNVAHTEIDDFLDTGASIEHKREHGVIPPACARLPVDAAQQGLDLRRLQIIDGNEPDAPLERDAEDPLEGGHVLWVFSD